MKQQTIDNFNFALDFIRNTLTDVAKEIKVELEKQLKGNDYKIDIRYGDTDNFRDYVWLHIKDKKNGKCYSISLFYNDINKKSSNPRTQFGRIQFWKDVIEKGKNIPSPHTNVVLDKDIKLKFLASKSENPKQAIYDGTYNVTTLVKDFIDFIK